jgi:hypothetical protein
MRPEMERRLAAFVDRVKEMTRFCEMLETREKLIMTVWGEAGLGKTSLFFRMVHECAVRKLRKAEVVWTDTRNHDYLAVMSKIRDDVGLEPFQRFTDLAETPFSAPIELNINAGNAAHIDVAHGIKVQDSTVGDIAFFKASQIVLPVSDMANIEKRRMIQLAELFLEGLSKAVESEPVVIFFDAIEKMSAETYNWIRDELLQAVLDGRLANVCFVLCGRQKPQFDRSMQMIVEEAQLQPLGVADIQEYLAKRVSDEQLGAAVTAPVCVAIANLIMGGTGGKPDEVAYRVEAFIKDCRSQGLGGTRQ